MMRKLGFLFLTSLLACSPDVDSLREKEFGGAEAAQVPVPQVPGGQVPTNPEGERQASLPTAGGQPPAPSSAAAGVVPAPGAVSVPAGNLRGDAAKGARIYTLYCGTCHGPQGAGDGPLAATLVPRPANHTDPAYMGTLSDEHLYKVIQRGGAAVGKSPLMAPWGAVVSEEQTRDLIAHLRTLSGT